MISITQKIRQAYFEALNGNLSIDAVNVPVVDGWNNALDMVSNHVIIKGISDTGRDNTQQMWGREATIEFDIITYQQNGFSSDDRDSLESQILQIVFPSMQTVGVTVTGIGLYNVRKDSANDFDEINDSGNIARKILRISQFIQQQ